MVVVKEEILQKMEDYFGSDRKRVLHARKVLEHAENILKHENGDTRVVVAAAILHDIGIKECEVKYNSTGGQLQEKEGPPIARKILQELGEDKEVIDEICQIIASHHSPGEVDSLNFRIIWDSDWLVNLADEYDVKDKKRLERIIDKVFLTKTGKKIATDIYL